jgi:hypothetical protein
MAGTQGLMEDPRDANAQRWRERLGGHVVRCPECLQAWLTVGSIGGEAHRCKACGCSFVVSDGAAPRPSRRR